MGLLRIRLTLTGLVMALLTCAGAPCRAGVVLRSLDAVTLDTSAHSEAGAEAAIRFVNDLDFAVDLYWIDVDGNRVYYTTILAGSSHLQLTFITHPLRRRANDGLVVRVHPVSGAQSLVSRGGLLDDPMDVAVEADGRLVVTNSSDYGATPRVVRVDPTTGTQTLVAERGLLRNPWGVVVDASGSILVTDRGFRGRHAIIRIHPQSGAQSVVSTALDDPLKLAIDGAGRLVVVESGARFFLGGLLPVPVLSRPKLVRIDPVTGARGELSATRFIGGYFRSVAVDADGRVLVGENRNDNVGSLYRIDGRRISLLARTNGFPLNDPLDLLVVPASGN